MLKLNPKQISDLTKAAQAFAYRGDDQRIHWAYEQAKSRGWLDDPSPESAMLTHYQATSLARADDWRSAKALWRSVVKRAGIADLAQDNLDDLRAKPGDRWGPFFFQLRDWLDETQQQDCRRFAQLMQSVEQKDKANAEATRRVTNWQPA